MHLDFTFVNESSTAFSEPRQVFLAIDDEHGQNYVRRLLPEVDLTKIKPGETLTFSETLTTPAFSPGIYVVHLWIPASDPRWQFDSAHNLLLSSSGVADLRTGLNTLVTFKVIAAAGSGPHVFL